MTRNVNRAYVVVRMVLYYVVNKVQRVVLTQRLIGIIVVQEVFAIVRL